MKLQDFLIEDLERKYSNEPKDLLDIILGNESKLLNPICNREYKDFLFNIMHRKSKK